MMAPCGLTSGLHLMLRHGLESELAAPGLQRPADEQARAHQGRGPTALGGAPPGRRFLRCSSFLVPVGVALRDEPQSVTIE